MKKLFWLLLLIPTLAFGASGDTVIDGQPVESLTAGQVVVTSPARTLVTNTGTTAAQISALTHGGNVDALHSHTNTSVSVTHASTTGQTASDHHDPVTVSDTATINLSIAAQVLSAAGLYTAGDALTLIGADFNFDGGAVPGGELGGTWASPTVNVIHSGSAHHDQLHAADHVNGTDDIQSATNAQKGLATAAQISAIEANMLKETNVSTNITVVELPTSVEIQSSDGTNDMIAAADTTNAGVMTTTMYDEHVVNNAKNTNVVTNLSEGTATNTTVDVNSSDGTNATLVSASTLRAGILTKAKFDEIVANSAFMAIPSTVIGSGTNLSWSGNTLNAADAYVGTVTSVATTAPITGGTFTNSGTIAITMEGDLATTAPLTGATADIFPGSGTKATLGITIEKDIVAGTDLNGGANNVLPGSDSDVTINLNSIISADTTGNAATATVAVKYIETGANPYVTISGGVTNGQMAIIKAINNTTSIRETGNIVLAGSTSFDMDTGDTLTCVYDSSDAKWIETGRSFAY